MNKQEMIDVIYEKIANKELSFGCKIIRFSGVLDTFIYFIPTYTDISYNVISWLTWGLVLDSVTTEKFEKYIIIWHPVMIWDVFEYQIENLWLNPVEFNYLDSKLLWIWKHKRLPIEQQSEECINYVYNLIIN